MRIASVARVRIVSLLPSATEILFAVGAGDDVMGVTFECDFPEAARDSRKGRKHSISRSPGGMSSSIPIQDRGQVFSPRQYL